MKDPTTVESVDSVDICGTDGRIGMRVQIIRYMCVLAVSGGQYDGARHLMRISNFGKWYPFAHKWHIIIILWGLN